MQPERILKALAITYGIYLLFALVIAMITSIGNLESFYTVMFIIAILPFAAIIENPITILFDVAAVFLAYCIVWTFENHRGESRYYPAAFLNKWNNLVTKLLVNKLHINKWTLTAVFSLLTVLIIGISLITPLAYVSIKYGYSSFISYISDCSSSSLYVEFKQKKYSGEDVSNLGDQDWWSRCSKSIREEAYSWIQEDRIDEEEKLIRDARTVTQAEQRLREQLENEKALRELILQNNDPTNCDRYGYAQYNALTEKCECKGSYVMIDNKCVTPPYCGDSATYSENSGECECNTGYKKVGKNCEYVSCTANSAYNPKTGNCECFSGYLVRNSQCKSSIELCGISGKYYTATGDCSECGYGEYLKGRDCVREPYCGVGSNFNPITEKCVCESGYLVKDGRCVSKYSYCDSRERYNDSTKKCECYSPYIRINGKCDRDYSWITE